MFFAASPDVAIAAYAGAVAIDVRRRLGRRGNADPAGAPPCLAAVRRWFFRPVSACDHRCCNEGRRHCFSGGLQGRVQFGQSGASALGRVLGDAATVPLDRGIFLPISRPMHSTICGSISDVVDDRRVTSDAGAANRNWFSISERPMTTRQGHDRVDPWPATRPKSSVSVNSSTRSTNKDYAMSATQLSDMIVPEQSNEYPPE